MTELNFWAAQCVNLESLFEQMQSNTTIKMASILFLTDSAYYPAFKLIKFLIPSLIDVQVDVSECGVCNEGGPGHHHPPKTSVVPLRG